MLVIPRGICIPVMDEHVLFADLYRAAAGGATVKLLGDGEGEPEPFSFEGFTFYARAPAGQAVSDQVLLSVGGRA